MLSTDAAATLKSPHADASLQVKTCLMARSAHASVSSDDIALLRWLKSNHGHPKPRESILVINHDIAAPTRPKSSSASEGEGRQRTLTSDHQKTTKNTTSRFALALGETRAIARMGAACQ